MFVQHVEKGTSLPFHPTISTSTLNNNFTLFGLLWVKVLPSRCQSTFMAVVACCMLLVASCPLPVASCKLQVPSCNLLLCITSIVAHQTHSNAPLSLSALEKIFESIIALKVNYSIMYKFKKKIFTYERFLRSHNIILLKTH